MNSNDKKKPTNNACDYKSYRTPPNPLVWPEIATRPAPPRPPPLPAKSNWLSHRPPSKSWHFLRLPVFGKSIVIVSTMNYNNNSKVVLVPCKMIHNIRKNQVGTRTNINKNRQRWLGRPNKEYPAT